jgi:hypothetical protein
MFSPRLRNALKNFNLESALALSTEIHTFEARGGKVSETMDKLWEQLTIKIEAARGNPMFVEK